MIGSNGNVGGLGSGGDAGAAAGDGPNWPGLIEADARALDALVESGWDAGRVPVEHRARAERLVALLGTLEGAAIEADPALEDLTLLRVGGLVTAPSQTKDPELSRADVRALDALVYNGFNPASERSSRHAALLGLLSTPIPMGDSEQLVSSTLGRVQSHIEKQADRFNIATEAQRTGRRGFRIADVASLAAMLTLGTIAAWPMLGAARERSRRLACENSMATAGIAFSTYSGANRDSMPLASACKTGSPWWDVGQSPERSNSANLFTLIRTGHASIEDLACSGNPNACRCATEACDYDWKKLSDVSYSYQNMYAPEARRPSWSDDNAAVAMIDRSPVILKAVRRQLINPLDNSPNHGELGQNALITDGSTRWMRNPVLENGDNVWLPRQIEQVIARLQRPNQAKPLSGTEAPDLGDAFLVP